jgi:undecaprenyl diphosphate synthase
MNNEIEKMTQFLSGNTGLTVVMALSYSSQWEIINAVKTIVSDVKKGKIDDDNISQELFDNYLSTANIPDPELMIRTSGEKRLSNFLLWQIAYAEIFVTPTLWPDFDREEFLAILRQYQVRERRFGKIPEAPPPQ